MANSDNLLRALLTMTFWRIYYSLIYAVRYEGKSQIILVKKLKFHGGKVT